MTRAPEAYGAVEAPDGARVQLAATVAALQKLSTYPGATRRIETVETHMSFVFLTEDFAYKLKKPIRTAMLDFTTLDARHLACETELALNRRLAKEVYLAVVPLVLIEGDLHLEEPGPVIDWLVKMRRLPRERMLDACIADKRVEAGDIDRLGAVLAQFYASATRAPSDGQVYRTRIGADIASKVASLAQPRYGLEHTAVRAAEAVLEQWLARHGDRLESRADLVVDAHGDLRPEHICLEDPTPVVIDCLEFSRSLRLLDPVSELSFLALECRRLGSAWVGERLLAEYSEASGDPVSSKLISFYQSYHALVRAAVAVWHLDDDALDHSERWRERGNWYLRAPQILL